MRKQIKKAQWGKATLPAALAAGLLALGLMVGQGATAEAGRKAIGTVNYLQGDAQRSSGKSWANLKKGAKLYEGDRIKTMKKARLEAKLKDGSMLRLGGSSELVLSSARFNKKKKEKKFSAKLVFGRAWAAVTSLFGSESKFEVTTDNAVAGVRGTRFSAQVDKDGSTLVSVYNGKVAVSNKPAYAIKGHTKANRVEVAGPQEISKKQWEEMVAGAMQRIRVASSGEMASPEKFEMASAEDDDWEKWNSERDEMAGLGHGKK